jgi:hypothetical protein
MKIEKYTEVWVLHLLSSTQGVHINPLKYRQPKWWKKLFNLSKRGLVKKKRISCAEYSFKITDEGKKFMKEVSNDAI